MKTLTPEQTGKYLGIVQSLRPFYTFHDVHVHPYEVLFDKLTYDSDATRPGVLSAAGNAYTTPTIQCCKFPEIAEAEHTRSVRLQEISAMLLKRIYGNIGEQVFIDQMNLSGVDRVLLLPVAAESSTPDGFSSRMQWVKQLYQDPEKFWIAGSIPGSMTTCEVAPYLRGLNLKYELKAMKCHPVVSGIDLGSGPGKEWLEELLSACNELRIPLIIHGGRNNPYWGGDRGNFGALDHFKDVNLSLSQYPVILAHAGFHRCRANDVQGEGLPLLDRMLERYPNLHIDISGLTYDTLKLVLQTVPGERVLFGSDALYSSQWEAMTLMIHALNELNMHLEENLIRFATLNPTRTIFKETSHVKFSQDTMEPVSGGSAGEVATGGP